MKIQLNRVNDQYLFECTNSQGNSILLDNTSQPDANGVSPMESVLMAVAACSGIDIISILQKQRQSISSFSAQVEAERVAEEQAKPFRSIEVQFFLEGQVDPQKAWRAAELSFAKYCSVSKTLEPKVHVGFKVVVNGAQVLEQ